MARLNDLPAAAESVESLKRRFIRQNREIARANSIQSLRIRTLESEVSRLLVENAALREEAIAANQELEKLKHDGQLGCEIDNLKSQLDAKLAEFGSLIADLGSLPRRRGLLSKPKRRSIDGEFQISPETTRRRSLMKAARQVTDESRLPAIMEDKFYPRLTLESEDFADLVGIEGGENDSPGVTSTPIPQPTMSKTMDPPADEEPSTISTANENPIQPSPSMSNLGARRSKRDSSLLNSTPRSKDVETNEQDFVPIHISKSGSKRKLSVRDDDDLMSQPFNHHDDFQYTRLAGASNYTSRHTSVEFEKTPTKTNASKPESLKVERTTVRRALGPKSTNITQRTSSPTKKNSGTGDWEKDIPKPNPKLPRNRSHDAIDKSIRAVPSTIKQTKQDVVDINIMPEQPPAEENRDITHSFLAEGDTTSFASTNPSETRLEPRDTSPVSAIGMTRPPRRSRGSISYAEPNLRDKMRRPTKELVDAVSGDARFRRSSKSDLDLAKERCGEGNSHDSNASSMAYNDSCASFLRGKDRNMMIDLPSNVTANRKRRTLSANKFDFVTTPETGPSMSSVAISTLMAGSKGRSNRERDASESSVDYEQEVGLRNSSTRTSRRHSSNPATSGTHSRSRRSQSSTTLAKENAVDAEGVLESAGVKASNKRSDDYHQYASSSSTTSSSNLRSMKGASEFDHDVFLDGHEGASDVKRVERLATSRRRSMML
ncbi:shugoshin [Histoplasma capsulatum var. duboisii H88]|nr:shugoshin [Histoplasma capsulatum H143]QSS54344.1 shugoshin [Histoplasma capsulatum var. duboisii H88]